MSSIPQIDEHFKVCRSGDDKTCLDYFGKDGPRETTCCWKATLVGIPKPDNDTHADLITQYLNLY